MVVLQTCHVVDSSSEESRILLASIAFVMPKFQAHFLDILGQPNPFTLLSKAKVAELGQFGSSACQWLCRVRLPGAFDHAAPGY